MKIAVLGAGAMGSIYGGHLSTNNDVYMIDKKAELVDKINADGLKLFENDTDVIYHPAALLSSEGIGEVDLVIISVTKDCSIIFCCTYDNSFLRNKL